LSATFFIAAGMKSITPRRNIAGLPKNPATKTHFPGTKPLRTLNENRERHKKLEVGTIFRTADKQKKSPGSSLFMPQSKPPILARIPVTPQIGIIMVRSKKPEKPDQYRMAALRPVCKKGGKGKSITGNCGPKKELRRQSGTREAPPA